jgi:glycosyltransferase involved in cell wall biosynthesis
VQNNFADRQNIELIRCGIPDQDYTNTPYKKSNESIRIFTASRLVKEKGIETFIRAASYVKESFPDIKFSFEIAGAGNYLNDLIKLNNDLNAGVKFAGVIVNIFPKLNEIDFFVMTSHSEGFPLSMVEAGLAKKFIITSRFDGLEYIFQDHNDGLTFEINNHKELAEKILFGISNADLANKLSLNFHNKVLKLFNAEIAAEKHLSLYKKCLNK